MQFPSSFFYKYFKRCIHTIALYIDPQPRCTCVKRCTCVNKWRNSGSRWAWDNYITRCHRWLGSVPVPVGVGVSWGQDASMRISLQTEGLWPSVTYGWAAQPECERSAAMIRRTWVQYVAVCPHLQLTSHTQPTSTLSRIKCERYIFIKKCVRSFIEVVHYRLIVSAYICICIRAVVSL